MIEGDKIIKKMTMEELNKEYEKMMRVELERMKDYMKEMKEKKTNG